jgi:hypothetical protein
LTLHPPVRHPAFAAGADHSDTATTHAATSDFIGEPQLSQVGAEFIASGANPLGFAADSWWDDVPVCRTNATNLVPIPREVPVSRASRVPYHQNVYDLLQIEPSESPEAARMIAEHEAQHGPLPASVREWYLLDNAMPHDMRPWRPADGAEHLQAALIDIRPLTRICEGFAGREFDLAGRCVLVMVEKGGGYSGPTEYWVYLRREDDPEVWCDDLGNARGREPSEWRSNDRYSHNIYWWIFSTTRRNAWWQPTEPGERTAIHANDLWLRAPDEPFQPPVIDFLTDHFGEPERTARPHNVTTHTFRPTGGTIRVTADEPTLTGALSAWWVHADTPERLAEFAELLRPWGTLRDTLCADTDPARDVLKRLKGERPV